MNKHISNARAIEGKPKAVFLLLEIIVVAILPFIIAIYIRQMAMDYLFTPLIENLPYLWFLSFRAFLFHFTSFGFIIIYLFAIVKYYEKRKIKHLGFSSKKLFFRGMRGIVLALVMMGAIVFTILILDQGTIDKTHLLADGLQSIPYLIIILCGRLIQGSAEEMVFQGWALPKIGKTYTPLIGVVFVSLLFAVAHGMNPNMSFLAGINLILYGLFAAFYVLYERSIIGIMMFHAFWNFFQGNVFGLAVSGSGLSAISFTSVVFEENSILNGGAFGAESSLITTIVLCIGVSILVFLYRKETHQKIEANEQVVSA
ncbi:MAG: CPBP family intramembrane glutamic endopeptidase [Candidatus Izemoplasmataceae bacterium]